MSNAQILLIESHRAHANSFAPALTKRGYTVTVEHSTQTVNKRLTVLQPDVVVLDAASLKTSGARMCRQLRGQLNGTPILLVADKNNPPDVNCGASALLYTPFTPRKLLNGVARLLPGDANGYMQVGFIRLNLGQLRIACAGREQRVTPKQAKLLEMFLRAPGELLTRKAIMKRVWDTDYTGDTRTLDVHISWLRGALEIDPTNPRFLKTIRGVGYRLDV